MKQKSGKKWLIASGIAAGALSAAAAVSHKVTKGLVSLALDRKELDFGDQAAARISGTDYQSPFYVERTEAAKRLREREHQTVELTASDGLQLTGHWFYREGAKRTIVAMHGWRSSWYEDFALMADFWLTHDCNVLFAEQRGQGSSGGDYMGFGLLERYDCAFWASWAAERCELPIYLSGISMGASTVLMASALDLPDQVCGIMADCGFTSPHGIWEHVVRDNMGLSYSGPRQKAIEMLCRQKLSGESAYYSCEDALSVCRLPVLFIHGSADRFVPVDMTYQNYQACSGEKRLLIVPGAGHGESYFTERQRYEEFVLDFWKDFDKSDPQLRISQHE